MLEVVDAIIFCLGYAQEGAVTELSGEGDTVSGLSPGFQVGREESAVVLGVAVVIVVGEVAVLNRNDGGSFGPRFGDWWSDVRPRALDRKSVV